MLLLSRKFWHDYRTNPQEALLSLSTNRRRISHAVLKFTVFVRITFSEYFMNHCVTRAGALAFALLLTLIPLLVCVSFMLTKVMEAPLPQLEKMVAFFLPFAPEAILSQVSVFFANAQKVKGLGIGVLIIVTLGMFGTVEEALNTIWKVTRSRSFFVRLRTFTMVMVYSPILFFASFRVRRSVMLDVKPVYIFSLDVLSFVLIVLAFAVFIWVVPNTRVRFRHALAGGIVAGILFQLERYFFSLYVSVNSQTFTIYGAFGLFLFFLISLFLASCFVLFGAETAFVAQNFRPLLRAKKRWERRISDYKTYFCLRVMIDTVAAFIRKRKPPTLSQFMKKYEMTETQAQGIVNTLVRAGFLHVLGANGKEAYVPTQDYAGIRLREILDSIEDENRRIPTTPDDFAKNYVAGLIAGVKERLPSQTDELTFEKLVFDIEDGEARAQRIGLGI
ncbi:MAG TPA: YhjD/YihY/BrkB family envelope integrity protein [Chitinivibrionales bacterium]|nr:YhjD/YihY/BrkB family envelope integrity protein [Chitinivibrionales bacterium]